MPINPKDLEKFSYADLQAAMASKKQGEVDLIKEKLKAARGIVSSLEAELEKLTGKSAPTGTRSPRGSIREAILKALTEKGALSIDQLRSATGIDKISPTLANLKIAKVIKQEGKRGPYVLVKK